MYWHCGAQTPPPQVTREIPVCSREPRQENDKAYEKSGNVWRTVSNAVFYAALALIAIGAVIFGSHSGGIRYAYLFFMLILLGSIAVRVFVAERKHGNRDK